MSKKVIKHNKQPEKKKREDTPVVIAVLANDTDPDGDPMVAVLAAMLAKAEAMQQARQRHSGPAGHRRWFQPCRRETLRHRPDRQRQQRNHRGGHPHGPPPPIVCFPLHSLPRGPVPTKAPHLF